MNHSEIISRERAVCVNAFRRYESNGVEIEEYTDNPELIDGWNVYLRVETPDDPQQPFDCIEEVERDFKTLELANDYATTLANKYNADIQHY